MKNKLLMLLGALLLCTSIGAKTIVPLTVSIDDDDMPLGNGYGKSPMRPPVVYLDDHTLSFVAGHPDYTLLIKDEDGDVVYTTTVFSAETEVVLPSTLSGDYEIQLTMGNWLFKGCINL